MPGIRAVAAFGHTPGHTLYMLETNQISLITGRDEIFRLLIWGDLTHAMAIQMPFPQVAVTFDVDNEKAVAARKKVLEFVAKNNITVAGIHNAYPGIGYLKELPNGGYQYTPVSH
jgi:glyoxylase-like metal-dependent hydrolase (beta-lactamase superfamily II)